MITVNYPDEGPVTYLSLRDKELLERVKRECGATIREIVTMIHQIFSADADPILVTGEPFRWHPRVDGISPVVPPPYANVDIEEARRVSERDAMTCQSILEDDCSMAML